MRARRTHPAKTAAVRDDKAPPDEGGPKALEPNGASPIPFKALIAASSFFVLVLSVAGFSLRWNYYYNFGLQNIVIEAPLSSLAVSAVEIIRTPENIGTLLLLGLEFFVPFEILLGLLRWLSNSRHPVLKRSGEIAATFSGLDNALFADIVRASLIVFVAFRAGGIAGSRDYVVNVVEATSRLPRVTAIANPAEDAAKTAPFPITCDTRPLLDRTPGTAPAFVGDPQTVIRLKGGVACSSDTQSWRLLHRDDKFAYLFLTVTELGRRPETLVISNADRLMLVLQ
jgi:hypothetical protein